jgi:hypothetical protein
MTGELNRPQWTTPSPPHGGTSMPARLVKGSRVAGGIVGGLAGHGLVLALNLTPGAFDRGALALLPIYVLFCLFCGIVLVVKGNRSLGIGLLIGLGAGVVGRIVLVLLLTGIRA